MKKSLVFLGITMGCLLLVLAIWLVQDEPELLYSIDVNEYVPMPEGGAEPFERLLALSQNEVAHEPLPHRHGAQWRAMQEDPERYRRFVLEHRETILQNYEAVQSLMPELYVLAEARAIGDTATDIDSQFLRFPTMRSLTWAVNFHTALSVWDPSLESGLDDLLAIHQVIRNLAPNTRVLVNGMIAVVIVKENLETLDRILPELSEEDLVRVRAVIGEPLDHVAVIGNSLLGEYCSTARAIDKTMEEQRSLPAFFFYDRHRTLNTYGSYMHLVRQKAEAGQWAQLNEATDRYFVDLDKQKLRNFIGWNFLQMATPAVTKTFEYANDVNQKQESLLRRIDERLAAGDI